MARLNITRHEFLTESVISKLLNKGIFTEVDILKEPVDSLRKIIDLSFKEIVEIKKKISNNYGGKVNDALHLFKLDSQLSTISTGIERLDSLLNGGLKSKHLYEFCGSYSCGKRQLSLTIALNISLNVNNVVHYIDTRGEFLASRILAVLEARELDDEKIFEVMSRIKITQVISINELITSLHHLTKTLKNENNTRLLIIDSLCALISPSSNDVPYFLTCLRNMLRFITNEYKIPVITTNLVRQWYEDNGILLKECGNVENLKPLLGKLWLHVPNTRLLIEHRVNEERLVTIWKSFDLLIGNNCNIEISDNGIS